ncbi:hypothetical protein BC739_006262 [Kutzneria viridogrisea]|uniref:Transposase n=1 Tax=Kutzneria viridogrisea TaxID=47990 RepID=A0ABR6BQ59_9PSEU|nr:hypothetical protein [Kutzneria albida]MBA8929044.1 hypothetical protein [Kutzneria viridogrisea]
MSWSVVAAAFAAHAATVLAAEPDPVAVLGIDETRRDDRSGDMIRTPGYGR